MSNVIVVGGGAAGMMAAIAAAKCGHNVTLLEKNEKLGKKLFITGKGRCNVTNGADMDVLFQNVCTNEKFLYSAFYSFDNTQVCDLIEQAGCPLKTERGDRVFPVSDHSSDVIAALQRELHKYHVDIHLHTEVKKILTKESDDSDILGEYEQTIREGNLSLQDSLIIAQELLDKVSKIADNIKRITGADSYEDILKAMASNPTSVAEFVSSPVKLQTVPVYPVEHYGSAASPFYTILAIWVGALFLVAIIHVGVKPIDPGDHYKEYERYFGRYLLFFLIGQAQTLLTILGNLYYIEIQCQHKFLYWLAAAVASAAFSCFMYSVTFAFGNVGEALAIVVMVIQVAGSGGTFPIEALPKVFQWIYPFLPFQFGMKAFKECIAGMYGVDYWINVGKMVLFLIIALLLGLALEPPFRKLNHRIEKSKEKTGLMI